MQKKSLKEEIVAYALVALGSLLFAVGDVMFVNPYHLAPGGVYGLANVFNALWGWKISVAGICMDVPLLIIGTLVLGPRFGIKTIVSVILIPVFTYIIESTYGYAPLIVDDIFLNTVVAGLIYGVAIGFLTVVIRNWGAYPEGMSFAILIMNAFTPLINTYVKPKRFGEVPAKQ